MGWTSQYKINSGFGNRADPFTGKTDNHGALDINTPKGTPIGSPTAGKVLFAGKGTGANETYGNFVMIQDALGNKHIFAHLDSVNVKTGQQVDATAILGKSGNTGRSSGPHLHYEVKNMKGTQIDPTPWMKGQVPQAKGTGTPKMQAKAPKAGGSSYTNTWKTKKEALSSPGYQTYKQTLGKAVADGKIPNDWVVALTELIGRESNWSTQADNPKSTAYGYGQFIADTVKQYEKKMGLKYNGSPYNQLLMTAEYVKDRYGTPEKALAHWDAKKWY